MKKSLLLLPLLVATTILTASAADPGNKELQTERAFQKQFSGAENVVWSKTSGGLQQVAFVWGGLRTIAYFGENAELLGSVRNVFFSQVPLTVLRSVENSFSNPVVVEVVEITNTDGTTYSMLLEEKNKKYRIRMNSYGDVVEKEKLKK